MDEVQDRTGKDRGLSIATHAHGQDTGAPAQVCQERAGPTPPHPEPGRETVQRRGYWGDDSLGDEVDAPVLELTRRGAVAARRAHNPKVDGSNPSAATITTRDDISIETSSLSAFKLYPLKPP